MNPLRWLSLLFLVIALSGTVGLGLQRQQTRMLREQIALLQLQQRELARLRAENTRLTGEQIPDAELASLRADHIAADRLRAELNTLRDSIRQAEAAATP